MGPAVLLLVTETGRLLRGVVSSAVGFIALTLAYADAQ
jgi:hypothetical protein